MNVGLTAMKIMVDGTYASDLKDFLYNFVGLLAMLIVRCLHVR